MFLPVFQYMLNFGNKPVRNYFYVHEQVVKKPFVHLNAFR